MGDDDELGELRAFFNGDLQSTEPLPDFSAHISKVGLGKRVSVSIGMATEEVYGFLDDPVDVTMPVKDNDEESQEEMLDFGIPPSVNFGGVIEDPGQCTVIDCTKPGGYKCKDCPKKLCLRHPSCHSPCSLLNSRGRGFGESDSEQDWIRITMSMVTTTRTTRTKSRRG